MLNQLTHEQEQLMFTHRQEWLDMFFRRNTLDREAATKGIEFLYGLCGLQKPMIIFTDSPMGCQIAANMLRQKNSAQVRAQVSDQVRDQVWDQVRDQVRAQVRDQVRDQVWDQVRDQVRAQVRAQVRDQVRDQVSDQVSAQVRDQKMEFFYFSSYGNVGDYGWVAFYDYFRKLGIAKLDKFDAFLSLLQSGVYDMIQLKGGCIVSACPTLISRDENNRLHSVTGPAVQFTDGYCQYFLHGRKIPSWIISEPEKITRDAFVTESNSEVRAAMYEVLGTEGTMRLLGASEVDSQMVTHPCGESETLTLYKTKETFRETNGKPLAWCRFVCPSTGTSYLIDVEPHYTCAIEAAKSTRPENIFEFSDEYAWNFRS